MKSGKAYLLLLLAGLLLVGFYVALSAVKPVNPKQTQISQLLWELADMGSTVFSEAQKGIIVEERVNIRVVSDKIELSPMQQRVRTLRQQCLKLQQEGVDLGHIQRAKLDHIIVNDKHKLLYCYVPKVACTNLKRIFLLLTGKMNETEPLKLKSGDVHDKFDKYLQYLDSLPLSGIKYRLQNYKKIIFVRDPLSRVLSAFRNKFLQKGNDYFKERFGRRIIRYFRENPSAQALQTGEGLTYSEFVQYLVHPKTIEGGYNEHWATFTDLCHPCHIQYDFIGKYEDLDEHVNLLLEDIGVSDIIKFPERGDTYKTLKTEDMLYKYYKDLKPSLLTRLITVYDDDFTNFGYEVPDNLKKLMHSLYTS